MLIAIVLQFTHVYRSFYREGIQIKQSLLCLAKEDALGRLPALSHSRKQPSLNNYPPA